MSDSWGFVNGQFTPWTSICLRCSCNLFFMYFASVLKWTWSYAFVSYHLSFSSTVKKKWKSTGGYEVRWWKLDWSAEGLESDSVLYQHPISLIRKLRGFSRHYPAGWEQRWERKAEIVERKQSEWNIKKKGGLREGKRAWCRNESGGARNILREEKKRWRRVGKGEWDVDGARRGVRFSVSPLWFIMKKFQGERAESKPEVTERRGRANNLPSCLCLHPPLCSLSVFIWAVARSPSLCSFSPGVCGLVGLSAARLCLRDSGAATNPNGIPKHNKSAREIDCLHTMYKLKTRRERLFCVFVVV